jgi:hypothetical protein
MSCPVLSSFHLTLWHTIFITLGTPVSTGTNFLGENGEKDRFTT